MQKIGVLAVIRGSAILAAALMLTICFAARSEAIVGDVTFTGLPPNESFTLTDDKGNTVGEGKASDQGIAVVPLTRRNLPAGGYTATTRGQSRRIQLRDGANTISLAGLVPPAIALLHSLQFYTGARWFDGALPLNGSAYIRGEYTAPGFFTDVFSLNPFYSFWVIPALNVARHKPYDHNGQFQDRIADAMTLGFILGLKHTSDLAKWGWTLGSARLLANFNLGLGWTYMSFDMKRLANPEPQFTNAKSFQDSDSAFRWEFGFGIEALWPNGFSLGLQKTNGFSALDVLNGSRTVRADGSVGVKIGYRFSGIPDVF